MQQTGTNFESIPLDFLNLCKNNNIINVIINDLHFYTYPLFCFIFFFLIYFLHQNIMHMPHNLISQEPSKYFATHITTRDHEGQMNRGNNETFSIPNAF